MKAVSAIKKFVSFLLVFTMLLMTLPAVSLTVSATASTNSRPFVAEFGQRYYRGEIIYYNGRLYEVLQDFTFYGDPNWHPGIAPSLWGFVGVAGAPDPAPTPTTPPSDTTTPSGFVPPTPPPTPGATRNFVSIFGTRFYLGEIVYYNGRLYRVLQDFTFYGDPNWHPGIAPSLWQFVGTGVGVVEPTPTPTPEPTPTPTPLPDLSIREFTLSDIAYSPIHENFRFVQGEILITGAINATFTDLYTLVTAHGGEIVGYISVPNEFQTYFGGDTTEDDLWALIDLFNAHPLVTLATLNLVGMANMYHPTSYNLFFPADAMLTFGDGIAPELVRIPNDALWADQWEDFMIGRAGGLNWGFEAIDAPLAWRYIYGLPATQPITVGVWDIGFDTQHEDVAVHVATANTGTNALAIAHGTEVAGIIGATADNNLGMAGLVWDAHLHGYAMTSDAAGNAFSLFRKRHALASLFATGSEIVNISLGHGVTFAPLSIDYTPEQIEFLQIEGLAMGTFLQRYLDLGFDFLLVNSAGNQSNTTPGGFPLGWLDTRYKGFFTNIPAQFPEVNARILIVGAAGMTSSDVLLAVEGVFYRVPGTADHTLASTFEIRSSSQLGNRVDILAPGSYIMTTTTSGYTVSSGTSMAAAFATGTAALVWQANPTLTGRQVRDIIVDSAIIYLTLPTGVPIRGASTPRHRYPLLNAANALRVAVDTIGERDEYQPDMPWMFFGHVTHTVQGQTFGVGGVQVRIYNEVGMFVAATTTDTLLSAWIPYDVGMFDVFLTEGGVYTFTFNHPFPQYTLITRTVTVDQLVMFYEFNLPFGIAPMEIHVGGRRIDMEHFYILPDRYMAGYALPFRLVANAAGFEVARENHTAIVRKPSGVEVHMREYVDYFLRICPVEGTETIPFVGTMPWTHNSHIYLYAPVLVKAFGLYLFDTTRLHQGDYGAHVRFSLMHEMNLGVQWTRYYDDVFLEGMYFYLTNSRVAQFGNFNNVYLGILRMFNSREGVLMIFEHHYEYGVIYDRVSFYEYGILIERDEVGAETTLYVPMPAAPRVRIPRETAQQFFLIRYISYEFRINDRIARFVTATRQMVWDYDPTQGYVPITIIFKIWCYATEQQINVNDYAYKHGFVWNGWSPYIYILPGRTVATMVGRFQRWEGRWIEIPEVMTWRVYNTAGGGRVPVDVAPRPGWQSGQINLQNNWFAEYNRGRAVMEETGWLRVAVGPNILKPNFMHNSTNALERRVNADFFGLNYRLIPGLGIMPTYYRITGFLEYRYSPPGTIPRTRIVETFVDSSMKAHTFNFFPYRADPIGIINPYPHPENQFFLRDYELIFDVPSGYHQTGVSFPWATNNFSEGQVMVGLGGFGRHLDGSTIEFMTVDHSILGFNPNNYRLVRIVVHEVDGEELQCMFRLLNIDWPCNLC